MFKEWDIINTSQGYLKVVDSEVLNNIVMQRVLLLLK